MTDDTFMTWVVPALLWILWAMLEIVNAAPWGCNAVFAIACVVTATAALVDAIKGEDRDDV